MLPFVIRLVRASAILTSLIGPVCAAQDSFRFTGNVVDADTGRRLAARVYLRSADPPAAGWMFVKSAAKSGSAVEYRKQRGPESVEMHTTVSAHPFVVDAPPGKYTVTVERGKEYFPVTKTVIVKEAPVRETFRLCRWIDMAARGWYSGDTHVHRTLAELPNVMLAEDLNVSFPLTHWVTTGRTPPKWGDKTAAEPQPPRLIEVDKTHVIWPLNTEYEIFTVGGRRHTLGAVFVLDQKRPLQIGAPPVGPIARQARRQGALLDLDKHSWPWSLMLVPVMKVHLFELANNHVWRTRFFFRRWTEELKPRYLEVEADVRGMTERGWVDFGLGVYYALLNCGFKMQPSAGTASGVHPVPLGFGRVYVYLPDGFSYRGWVDGLEAGRSFVTTGPMLEVRFNGRPPGERSEPAAHRAAPAAGIRDAHSCRVTGAAESARPLSKIEIIVNGEVAQTIKPANDRTAAGAYRSPIDETIRFDGSSWLAVRCWEPRDGESFRYAHTAPVHFAVEGKPLRPRRAEVDYLIRRMEEELARNRDVLTADELDEFRKALLRYRQIAKSAR